MIQKRDCLAYQLAHFKGLSAEDVIDSMMTPKVDGERVKSSRLSDKTAQIALEYRDRQARFNREWYEWLEKQWQLLNDEIVFLESAIAAMRRPIPGPAPAAERHFRRMETAIAGIARTPAIFQTASTRQGRTGVQLSDRYLDIRPHMSDV